MFKKVFDKQKKIQKNKGFTLVEMIVAVSLFVVVVMISISALISIADASRKANAIKTVMDNLNFALDSMSRNIRTGHTYSCDGGGNGGGNCTNGGDSLQFVNSSGNDIRYRLLDGQIEIIKSGVTSAITAPEIEIDSLRFYVLGSGEDEYQPRVLLNIQGTAGTKEKLKTSFNLQTTISQRQLDS